MSIFPAKILFTFFSLTLLVEASLNLHSSDSDSLQHLVNFNNNNQSNKHLCNSVEIFCETRFINDLPVLRVTRIIYDSKRLIGSLSSSLGNLTELKQLSLPNNQLVDRIPSEIVDLQLLEVLNLRNNRFSGQIPPGISNLVSLRILDLSFNRLSGNLNFLKNFPNLEELYLSDNLFSGKIPISLRTFRNLRFLNLSGNIDLQGSVPKSLNGVQIEYSLPKRYIFAENHTRNGNHSYATELSPAPSPLPAPHHHDKGANKARGFIVGFFVGVASGMVSGFFFSLLFKILLICIRGRERDSGPVIFSPMIKNAECLAFLEKEDGLASLQLIGRGGCGEVYRAELPGSDGKFIAIKRILQPSIDVAELTEEDSKLLNKKMRQVRSEIQTVGQIRHRNLLPLLAHVCGPDCHYLVYEFMKNGSVHDLMKKVAEGLVMGKLPSDEFFQQTDEMILVKWLRNVMNSDNPSRAIDPNLMGNGLEEQMLLVLKIAYFCTLDDPKQRPNSKDVRCMLAQVKH
ncbi:Leucine-rich repeat receptor-like serine/threonine/tyrosine-protein kinase SOBIR1 [Thalictrum thalictroides]|uniref:Leucine-rich repeat receptor-like serine/threonine/tyrosine-protein kinase SOBIR1 n=1 Tax=Thalictrum thalictroides TaxID=46969 RepID=A0A7J6UYJ6_THATH|nr:Leucine-rich repeat receptor-like serine/threonine/tyrosine-protein kinase SOBIR1 [Thalictrum thalictroides]